MGPWTLPHRTRLPAHFDSRRALRVRIRRGGSASSPGRCFRIFSFSRPFRTGIPSKRPMLGSLRPPAAQERWGIDSYQRREVWQKTSRKVEDRGFRQRYGGKTQNPPGLGPRHSSVRRMCVEPCRPQGVMGPNPKTQAIASETQFIACPWCRRDALDGTAVRGTSRVRGRFPFQPEIRPHESGARVSRRCGSRHV